MNNDPTNKIVNKRANNRPLLIFVCIFLAIVLTFGVVMVTVTLVRQSRYAVKYEGDGMDVKTASYFVSYYKYQYIGTLTRSGVNAYDAPSFWSKTPDGGNKTYGELLKEGAAQYLKEILAANALYDRYESLDDTDKNRISESVSAKLNGADKMDGTVKTFNTLTEPYGYDYKAFERAAEMLYKASRACGVVFGDNGEVVQASTEDCEEYLSTYSHVRLMFVNSSKKRNGEGALVDMTEEEKNAMNADLDELRSLIENGTASLATFERYFDKYNFVTGFLLNGEYYLKAGSRFTEGAISESFPEVIDTALDMKLDGRGEAFGEAEYDDGICFIYKYEPESGAYADAELEIFFEDFYTNASTYFYAQALKIYAAEAVITDKFYKIDILALPYNYDYFIKNF